LNTTTEVPEFLFDTGLQTYFWDGASYAFSCPEISFLAPITIDKTLSTGGESYYNSYSLMGIFEGAGGNWKIVAIDYPNSLSVICPNNINPYGPVIYSDFTAPNGFEGNLITPEPSAFLLSLLSCSVMLTRRKR